MRRIIGRLRRSAGDSSVVHKGTTPTTPSPLWGGIEGGGAWAPRLSALARRNPEPDPGGDQEGAVPCRDVSLHPTPHIGSRLLEHPSSVSALCAETDEGCWTECDVSGASTGASP